MGGSYMGECTITCNDGTKQDANSCPQSSSGACIGHGGVKQFRLIYVYIFD